MEIAILGFGNIAKGVEELIFKNREKIKNITGKEIFVKSVLIKDISKKREPFDRNIYFTDDFSKILEDKDIEIIIELTGDVESAFYYISESMNKKKHIITANKAVVSKYFYKFYTLSLENDVAFLYEASVGGGVHIIKSIIEDLPLNDIYCTRGILNGTCNFILSSMKDKNLSFDDALKLAQNLGFAEINPSDDILGLDTRRKLKILSSLIFGKKIDEKDIFTQGISNIKSVDIDVLNKRNLKVKLIGQARRIDDKYSINVMPVALNPDSIYYEVNNELNMISYIGNNIGEVFFSGKGAGRYPTADAVVRDLIDVLLRNYIVFNPIEDKKIDISNDAIESLFYIRIPKEYLYLIKDISKENIEISEYVIAFTKEIKLSYIESLINKMDSDDYFFARISKE